MTPITRLQVYSFARYHGAMDGYEHVKKDIILSTLAKSPKQLRLAAHEHEYIVA